MHVLHVEYTLHTIVCQHVSSLFVCVCMLMLMSSHAHREEIYNFPIADHVNNHITDHAGI